MTTRPSDPVLDFIFDRNVEWLVTNDSDRWPWSRISASRLEKIAYRLIVLRCVQIGIDPPNRKEAAGWR